MRMPRRHFGAVIVDACESIRVQPCYTPAYGLTAIVVCLMRNLYRDRNVI